ncbi:Sulfite reductase [NADPH] flavoprotein alpha-component [Thalassovita gelatinovora]|uniref:Sulfite reductase [NADPH] flavoprotein alpha-component n=1 Tax=Thalassovita gelatinovora TaxID=53501 RepID=A0A0P1FQZ7_THAGE|nr:flavodoxin domain-containing protein [Thalassovita gelatinovora]QIZ79172.1 nitric oxide synthase [Thalassovita gelatinovora]CUH63636.1 Sulfite reductase [NADPH] flavoprotein alpha-component [Thalassovita gelatinovora]SER00802.1 MioC protein [Thalassovita gelatinovora]
MNIAILFGTETGNAEMLAEDISSALEDEHQTRFANLQDTGPSELRDAELNIIVCSSYGDGELPASAKPFADRLREEQTDLDGVRFAMFGLGDGEYATTFGHGSMKLAEMLIGRGAEIVGERLVHDASGDDLPEDIAIPWAEAILASGNAAAASTAE